MLIYRPSKLAHYPTFNAKDSSLLRKCSLRGLVTTVHDMTVSVHVPGVYISKLLGSLATQKVFFYHPFLNDHIELLCKVEQHTSWFVQLTKFSKNHIRANELCAQIVFGTKMLLGVLRDARQVCMSSFNGSRLTCFTNFSQFRGSISRESWYK